MAEDNPRDIKPQVYRDPRPAEHFTRYHLRAREGIGWTYDAARILMTLPTVLLYRTRAIGLGNVPAEGPLIVTPNHFSQMDHFFVGVYLRRKVQFMAKSQLYTNPILTYVFEHGGAFPVRRGYDDRETFETAREILAREGTVLVYAEGGRSRTGDLGKPKRGVGRIALETGAPVVPVTIHGSAGVRRWRRLRFPKVTVQFGEPLTFPAVADPSREEQREVANRVFDEVRRMYVALEEKGRRGVLRSLRERVPSAEPGKASPRSS